MYSDRIRRGMKVILNGKAYTITHKERHYPYWRVRIARGGEEISLLCTKHWYWNIETMERKRRKRKGRKAI